ncbi:amidohydrolase [Afifella sp. YEN Y35]|uniref:amidohydrolase n=1 Tax=Afifella sp. YEN Y35 TaxID=3388337 RepID=UPI0039E0471C
MLLSNRDIVELTEWRRKLHKRPEISGEEEETAAEVAAFLAPTTPDRLLTGLGGHGLAALYESGRPGPTLMFRCELDALPITEGTEAPHRSEISGKGHLCGHDGHMAILAGVARSLACRRPESGRVILLFQPAEETGAGAASVLADPRFAEIAPDFAFALHNFPGLRLGHVALKDGAAACASRGMKITLTGRTAHASQPETGLSPMPAVARLMPELTALAAGGALVEDFSLVTITHATMGEPAFGIAPGEAEIFATLRTLQDARMEALVARAEALVAETAGAFGLSFDITYEDVFLASDNDPDAVAHLRRALDHERIFHAPGEPMRASEDFGRFGTSAKSALLFLGAGETHPPLHDPEYDFPDDLIAIGARIFLRTAYDILG